ncbi:UNVERIFIED_CONTAM: Serine/threonine-protein phosphatase 7 long form [Sesamum angustifolium]|uniref:Serine/threonine-protein phosphatase 7 long form n=1 Tax=Sesamum angustifolium TaxID=2727405 RepID=A0AAW2PUC7_9LAMI
MDRRAVYGPRDGTVLSQQSQHRSDEILDGDIDEVLQTKRVDGKFWRNLREQDLPIRVQQILHQIGFNGVYRCGRIQYDCHLITALVERWRSETHSFHFRVGEATVTLQDVQYIGFAPEEGALKGSRLQVKAIIHHISRVHITPDTPHLTVVQYARAVALLLLGGTMCPDSSETCEKGKAAIGGALQLVQIGFCSTYSTSLDGKDDMTQSYKDNHFQQKRYRSRILGMIQQHNTSFFVSLSTDRRVESGYQPGDAPVLQIVTQQVNTLQHFSI